MGLTVVTSPCIVRYSPTRSLTGVGTKPDMLTPGSLSALASWQSRLDGTQSNLKHGYYCVRLPNDKERLQGPSRTQLKAVETEFFETTEPWKDIADRSRLGMRNFVESTSELLISLIETKWVDSFSVLFDYWYLKICI